MYDRNQSIYAGMDDGTLQAALTAAQTALLQLNSGAKLVKSRYKQGDAEMEAQYTPADKTTLTAQIMSLQAALGITTGARRPLGIVHR